MRAVTVGLDVGTTNTKAVVLDIELDRMVALASTPTPVSEGDAGPVRDAAAVGAAARQVLDRALGQAVETVGDVDVLALATASVGEEAVLLDADGTPLAEVPVWYGPHGPEEADRRLGGGRGPVSVAEIDWTFSVFKLAWYATHRPKAFASASVWTDLSGFVAADLLGRGTQGAVVDTSHASRTGLLDLRARRWDLAPLAALELACPMPPLWESGTVIAATAVPVGRLPAGVPVVAGGHDHFCGAYGAGLTSGGTAYLSAGTSEAQLVVSTGLPDAADGVEVGCYVADRLYYAHLPMPSGRLYQRWKELLYGPDADDAEVLAELDGAAGSGRMRAVVDRRSGAVDLVDVPVDVTREELIGALMVGIARQADEVTDLLAAATDVGAATDGAVTRVLVAGAPTRSPAWRRLRQEASSRELVFVEELEPTAVGAARLAARGVGVR